VAVNVREVCASGGGRRRRASGHVPRAIEVQRGGARGEEGEGGSGNAHSVRVICVDVQRRHAHGGAPRNNGRSGGGAKKGEGS